MQYIVKNHTVKAEFFSDAQDKIEKVIQPYLNEGFANGWRLHSF